MSRPCSFASGVRALVLACAALLAAPPAASADLVINSTFLPSVAPANIAGGGNLIDIFDAAVSSWEAAFKDPADHWVVDLQYQWGPLANQNGVFSLISQGGNPHRIISGLITLDNSGHTPYFADPTPRDHSEYAQYHEVTYDTPEGGINAGRYFTGATGDAAGRIDLMSVAAHEIGHALGLAADNTGAPSTIIVTPPRPFAGALIPSFGSDHLLVGQALMNPVQDPGIRYLISGVDVLAEAEISQFARPNLDPYAAVPEPGAVTMMLLGLSLVLASRARGRVVLATRLPVGG